MAGVQRKLLGSVLASGRQTARTLLDLETAPSFAGRRALSYFRQDVPRRIMTKRPRTKYCPLAALAGFSFGGTVAYLALRNNNKDNDDDDWFEFYPRVGATLPEFSSEEVALHNSRERGIWVTYDDNVYDITEFVESHPGGERIMLAAGGSIEPYWNIYTIHHNANVKEILQDMRIGRVRQNTKKPRVRFDDPYANDPVRSPAFIVNSSRPFDAETLPEILSDHYYTPNDCFYVRNHLPVPQLSTEDYELVINIPNHKEVKLSLDDIKSKFEHHKVVATLQCAGNRRGQMMDHKKIFGATAGHTAIGNAEWTGVKLCDILAHCGLTEEDTEQIVRHVQFEGWDKDITGDPYAASIPAEKATNPKGDVLLAFEMNGAELPRDHGYPLRLLVPGVVGARSVKWLRRITASEHESDSSWQQLDYKSSPPGVEYNTFNFAEAPPIYEAPVQSAVCVPKEGAGLDADEDVVTIKGYAYSGGGNRVLRVDVSIDGGETWQTAELDNVAQRPYRAWAWTLWEATVEVPEPRPEKLEILCKATDTSHNVQPESVASIWNVRGFLNNSWHRVNVAAAKPAQSS